MRTERSHRQAGAWPAVVCAVLFGLFLMHGTPSAAAEGCHTGMSLSVAPVPAGAAAHAEHSAGRAVYAEDSAGAAARAERSAGHAAHAGPAAYVEDPAGLPAHAEHMAFAEHPTGSMVRGMARGADSSAVVLAPPAVPDRHGSQCVATPARDRLPLPTPWALAVAVVAGALVWASAGRRVAAGETGRRGPPGGGRDLLLRVCIART
ncbi:hypothetical protein [Streptomyces sp. V3I7]|uniref:hypothetical protein n=1 Tax=Streptomyces sp. V3I7 TaxID=3042278 RepID=UPI0027849342|nr:hypothetical protein [Streptomyces sp. V3I7]MDQ0991452.1 hypothetical protein [Streptomyces sp. V3I7]